MRELTSHQTNALNEALVIKVLDNPGAGGMCHVYEIDLVPPGESGRHLNRIRFQRGPIKEAGYNGLTNEALLAIVIDRLEGAQAGPFACKDNEDALGMIKGGLTCLQKRTKTRVAQGVEGTSVPHVEVPAPPPDKKYAWTTKDGDDEHGPFDSIDGAVTDAKLEAKDLKQSLPITIFDCRPATDADKAEFEGAEDHTGDPIDLTKPDWFVGKWVPENIALELVVEPPAVAVEEPATSAPAGT